ncbi:hypothetical protein AA313_de0200440 [Arthrobotrys entomopaga]|nr:hypothetical protein AA313_de0200440 [Arthrobotrys entomopaga]
MTGTESQFGIKTVSGSFRSVAADGRVDYLVCIRREGAGGRLFMASADSLPMLEIFLCEKGNTPGGKLVFGKTVGEQQAITRRPSVAKRECEEAKRPAGQNAALVRKGLSATSHLKGWLVAAAVVVMNRN